MIEGKGNEIRRILWKKDKNRKKRKKEMKNGVGKPQRRGGGGSNGEEEKEEEMVHDYDYEHDYDHDYDNDYDNVGENPFSFFTLFFFLTLRRQNDHNDVIIHQFPRKSRDPPGLNRLAPLLRLLCPPFIFIQ